MIHYLIVRRDLPFGTTLAQLAHAAANSMADWIRYNTHPYIEDELWAEVDIPSHWGMTVVVLGVKGLARLRKVEYRLKAKGVAHTVIREPDQPWNDQMMAIGVWPHEDEPEWRELFAEYEIYHTFQGPKETTDEEAEARPQDRQGELSCVSEA